MNRRLVIVALAFASLIPSIALADGFGSIQSRGGTMMGNTGGPLAASVQDKPVVVRIHADWCPACHATQATLDAVTAKYQSQITYVVLDVTNGKTSAGAQSKAESLGLGKFYDATKVATSTVAVINPRNGDIVAELYADTNASDYDAAIAKVESALSK
jgi:thiol-disulfide isomerase/thioredoxin